MLKLQMLDFLSLMFDALKKQSLYILRTEESTSILLSTCESCHFVNLQTSLSVDNLIFLKILYLLLGLFCTVKNITHLFFSLPMSSV